MTSSVKSLLAPLTESKLPIVYAKGSLRFQKVKLDTARNGYEVNLEGGGGADFVYFDENTTANTGATMTVDEESSTAQIPIGPTRGFRDYPCKRIFITCAAVAGGVLNIWYGKGVFLYGQTPGARGQWYDRNPLAKCATYNAGAVAPHADTARFTYTVPTLRKFQLQILFNQHTRQSAAAPVGQVESYVSYNAATGGSGFLSDLNTYTNAIGDGKYSPLGGGATMLAGDSIQAHTQDLSTGGTVLYTITIQGIEFDA